MGQDFGAMVISWVEWDSAGMPWMCMGREDFVDDRSTN